MEDALISFFCQVLLPFLNIRLFRDFNKDYIQMYIDIFECKFTHFALYVVGIGISKRAYI